MADDFGLLVDFLGHEVAMAALVDDAGRGAVTVWIGRVTRLARGVEDRDVGALDDRDVAVFEIGDAVGEGRERERVRAEIGFLLAIADGERAAAARADQKRLLAP